MNQSEGVFHLSDLPLFGNEEKQLKELNIKTICIQYANLGVVSPMMIPSSDYFLVFSKIYENVYKWKDLWPKKFKHIGYSFIYNALDNNEVNIKISGYGI